tara:strand:- start:345 stop:2162 length:1818 start_codon:yes stop_codon:yes gene_type:complete
MCGIFGATSSSQFSFKKKFIKELVNRSESRGSDSSGIILATKDSCEIHRADYKISYLYKTLPKKQTNVILGHSRLTTNGNLDNQPIYKDDVVVFHNGIILNHDHLWKSFPKQRKQVIDTEIIASLTREFLKSRKRYELLGKYICDKCEGTLSCAIYLPKKGKLILFSNNGSLFLGSLGQHNVYASERYTLENLKCTNVRQVFDTVVLDACYSPNNVSENSITKPRVELLPTLAFNKNEEKMLIHRKHSLKRCTKCVLPETMPYIKFNKKGVCNYCENYELRNVPKPKEVLFNLLDKYIQKDNKCIVPLSGGRDSFYCLDIVVNELGLKPITYTYDWGMVTDLARRNISRICSSLGVENIIVAADIAKKRNNVRKNLIAWLKSPHLGMISILTAGDKHFFKYIEEVKQQTNIDLNLWGINPLEVTHFKAGFLGIPPNFEEKRVYSSGIANQLRYQKLRFKAMMESPGYFNSSLFDTLSGEYYRTFKKKKDYFHIFDYWKWDEYKVNKVLEKYDWEKATDTNCTWRVGDGTAAFYNYIYYHVAGFTEHDTFRSNQIREGDLTREDALKLVEDENTPRYENIKWYLNAINLDFRDVIKIVNQIDPLKK